MPVARERHDARTPRMTPPCLHRVLGIESSAYPHGRWKMFISFMVSRAMKSGSSGKAQRSWQRPIMASSQAAVEVSMLP